MEGHGGLTFEGAAQARRREGAALSGARAGVGVAAAEGGVAAVDTQAEGDARACTEAERLRERGAQVELLAMGEMRGDAG